MGKYVAFQLPKQSQKGESWRIGKILEISAETEFQAEPITVVHYCDCRKRTHKHINPDIQKREYRPGWIDMDDGMEVYAWSHKNGETMDTEVHHDQWLTQPFDLERNGNLPPHIVAALQTSVNVVHTSTRATINQKQENQILLLIQAITEYLEHIHPFPIQKRNNYSHQPVEGFILGVSRTFDLETQHLQQAAQNRQHPKLLKMATQLMHLHDPEFTFSSIQVNHTTGPVMTHKDQYNEGPSYIIGLGNYTEGEFIIENTRIDIKQKFYKFEGTRPHKPAAHKGHRYTLIYFTPKPSVKAAINSQISAKEQPNPHLSSTNMELDNQTHTTEDNKRRRLS